MLQSKSAGEMPDQCKLVVDDAARLESEVQVGVRDDAEAVDGESVMNDQIELSLHTPRGFSIR
jgi:hypothetical protein